MALALLGIASTSEGARKRGRRFLVLRASAIAAEHQFWRGGGPSGGTVEDRGGRMFVWRRAL